AVAEPPAKATSRKASNGSSGARSPQSAKPAANMTTSAARTKRVRRGGFVILCSYARADPVAIRDVQSRKQKTRPGSRPKGLRHLLPAAGRVRHRGDPAHRR